MVEADGLTRPDNLPAWVRGVSDPTGTVSVAAVDPDGLEAASSASATFASKTLREVRECTEFPLGGRATVRVVANDAGSPAALLVAQSVHDPSLAVLAAPMVDTDEEGDDGE